MRNPAAMQQAQRSQDLAMSQLENIPGGFNALRRMFEEVQQPMMEASQNMSGGNNTTSGTTTNATPPPVNPTSTALPNPWGGGNAAPSSPALNPFAAMGGRAAAGGFNPYSDAAAGMMGLGGGMMNGTDPSQIAAMMQNPMMQQMMQQMLSDPQTMEQVS